jgi:hypothetical protein
MNHRQCVAQATRQANAIRIPTIETAAPPGPFASIASTPKGAPPPSARTLVLKATRLASPAGKLPCPKGRIVAAPFGLRTVNLPRGLDIAAPFQGKIGVLTAKSKLSARSSTSRTILASGASPRLKRERAAGVLPRLGGKSLEGQLAGTVSMKEMGPAVGPTAHG